MTALIKKHRRTLGSTAGAVLALLGCLTVAGCDTGAVRPVRIPIREHITAIGRCRQYLEGYARGEPVGSEVIGFQQLIDEATQENAEIGAAIGRGLREIEASLTKPRDVAAKAKAILESLPAVQ